MTKQKLFVDMDNTLVNSTEKIAELYNKKFANHPNFISAKWWECTDYQMTSICPLMTHNDKMNFFSSPEFFEDLELINCNTYEILERLNKKYETYILSIGQPKNLAYKALYLEKKLPFIQNYILLKNSNCQMNKSIVNASNGDIIIDDIPSNLDSFTGNIKILFGEECEWTKSSKYMRAMNWTDIERMLL